MKNINNEEDGRLYLDSVSAEELIDGFIKAEWRDETILGLIQNVIALRRHSLNIPYGFGEINE